MSEAIEDLSFSDIFGNLNQFLFLIFQKIFTLCFLFFKQSIYPKFRLTSDISLSHIALKYPISVLGEHLPCTPIQVLYNVKCLFLKQFIFIFEKIPFTLGSAGSPIKIQIEECKSSNLSKSVNSLSKVLKIDGFTLGFPQKSRDAVAPIAPL